MSGQRYLFSMFRASVTLQEAWHTLQCCFQGHTNKLQTVHLCFPLGNDCLTTGVSTCQFQFSSLSFYVLFLKKCLTSEHIHVMFWVFISFIAISFCTEVLLDIFIYWNIFPYIFHWNVFDPICLILEISSFFAFALQILVHLLFYKHEYFCLNFCLGK